MSMTDPVLIACPACAAMNRVPREKLGARGTSMIHASGDGGVSGAQGGACLPGGRLRPTWPASSPYVTSVGATDASFAAAAGFSAGGFSNYYAPAPYQAASIAAYLAANAPVNLAALRRVVAVAVLAALAAGAWPRLQMLFLTDNPLGNGGAAALAAGNWPFLEALFLTRTGGYWRCPGQLAGAGSSM